MVYIVAIFLEGELLDAEAVGTESEIEYWKDCFQDGIYDGWYGSGPNGEKPQIVVKKFANRFKQVSS